MMRRAENWATIAARVETCKPHAIKPHAIKPHACLTAPLRAIVSKHKQSQIDDPLPWNYAAKL